MGDFETSFYYGTVLIIFKQYLIGFQKKKDKTIRLLFLIIISIYK